MNEIQNVHRQAMQTMDSATLARMNGDHETADRLLRDAFHLEKRAAIALEHEFKLEPSRSVLFRSAATLAFSCKLYFEAERLIYKALLGEPPQDIANELRDLLDQVSFQRHLELRGVEISSEEFQMSITGKSVGFGIAPVDIFFSRVRTTESLLFRTAERQQGREFRERGARARAINDNMQLFVTVPRAACFAVTFRIGNTSQMSLPGLSIGEQVIDELLECLELYSSGEQDQLKERITEEAYYRNFVSLAQNLEPDGSDVDMVGFTAIRRGRTKRVAITRASNNLPKLHPDDVVSGTKTKGKSELGLVDVQGVLKLADSRNKEDQIEIVMSGKPNMRLIVPPGMMNDIVRPLWDTEVRVIGSKKGKKIHLVKIQQI